MTVEADTSIPLLDKAAQQKISVASTTTLTLPVQHNGAAAGSEPTLDLEDGTGITWTVTDDVANARIQATPVLQKDGWWALSGTFSYASADAPTFVITPPSDLTGSIEAGMRLKLTQTTVKYFIVTAITASTITVYGGTDYTLANAAISLVYYSLAKAPYGFPLNPDKWTQKLSDSSTRSQSNPTGGTWYNPGSLSLSIPIGAWWLEWKAVVSENDNSVITIIMRATLSTANNSESDSEFTAVGRMTGASANLILYDTWQIRKAVVVAAKTSYYLNVQSGNTISAGAVVLQGAEEPTLIRAVCAHL